MLNFALCRHLDQVDGVDIQRIVRTVLPPCILGADVSRGNDLEAEVGRGCKEVDEKASSVETPTVAAPWTPSQIKLHTVALDTRSMNAGHTGKIVLHDASFQHLLISGDKVDESKVVCAGKTDAGKAGCGWNASSE